MIAVARGIVSSKYRCMGRGLLIRLLEKDIQNSSYDLTIRNCRGNCDVSDDTSPLQFLIVLPYRQLSITNEQTITGVYVPYLRVWSTRGKIDRSYTEGSSY